uniref:Neuropeptide Y receptor type 2 n=2 Tax=Gasterosteus aculeatus aculeatus TaxID=481459 RepID=A0AAQ4RVR7_GASAC|nr:neuropeptide Y receptor type 2 isoform X1 [Gasterosteus aculeatus aculeatus]
MCRSHQWLVLVFFFFFFWWTEQEQNEGRPKLWLKLYGRKTQREESQTSLRMESDLRRLFAMDAADQVNASLAEDSPPGVNSSNCCPNASAAKDRISQRLDDSTKLLGVQVILILAYSAIILFGVIGNSLVIYVVYKFKTLRTVTNFFIVNLAVADLLVNTLCLPFTLVYTLDGEWKLGRELCFALPFAQGLAVHVSTVTLNVIALDRHRTIVHHTKTQMSRETCAGVVVVTWAVSGLLASPLAIFREYKTVDLSAEESLQVCMEKWPSGGVNGSAYSISALVVQYGLPLAINCFVYTRIWNKLKSHMTFGGRGDRHQRRRNTTKMLWTMVVVFAVSWLPFHAFQLAVDIDSAVLYRKDFKLLFTAFHVVAMCSTFVNPILYGWLNKNFRAAFLSVCSCGRRFKSRSGDSRCRETRRKVDGCYTESRSTNV